MGSAEQEFADPQFVDMAARRVAAVMKVTVPVELVSKELQPNDKTTVPSNGDGMDARMA